MPNRYVCDVLEEMRKCHETRCYGVLPGLIEEVQTLVNRMEAALNERHDYNAWHARVNEEKAEVKRLIAEGNKLRKKQGKELKEVPRYP